MFTRPLFGLSFRLLRAVPCLGALALDVGDASALSRADVSLAAGFLLIQQQSSVSELEASPPIADLNQGLEATRTKLEELVRVTELVVTETRERQAAQLLQLQVLQREIERLTAELWQASERTAELEGLNERGAARITALTTALEEARHEAARIDDALALQIERNAQLGQDLAQADTAREAAEAESQRVWVELTTKLQAATGAAHRSSAELADVREQLKVVQREVGTAKDERAQVEARAFELQEAVQRSAVNVQHLEVELEAVKEQFSQAAGAAVQAERSRKSAYDTAEVLRAELAASDGELERFRTSNIELEQQIASIRANSGSLTEIARQNLSVIEQALAKLNAAIHLAKPEEAAALPAEPVLVEDERTSAAN